MGLAATVHENLQKARQALRPLLLAVVLPLALSLAGVACEASSVDPQSTAETCAEIAVDPFKELLIVDEAVLRDPRSSNSANGIWSFRRRLEELTPPGKDPALAAAEWLASWRAPRKINLFDVPARPFVDLKATCNWLRARPENQCDVACTTCVERTFDLARAPFRLLAIANRADLVQVLDMPDTAGEARFVYALTQGPGDDPASEPLNMTVIFEYRQPLQGRTRKQAAEAWHALGRSTQLDNEYRANLESLLRISTDPGAEPGRPLGSALGQVRTNEREFEWEWDLREFTLTESGLTASPIHNTPDASMNSTPEFAAFLLQNREAILASKHVMPKQIAGGHITNNVSWSAPEVPTDITAAFSQETCNGCHELEQAADFHFHISPFRTGTERLSRFVYNPNDPGKDDLSKRVAFMRTQLCSP